MNEAIDPYSKMVEREAFVTPQDFHIYRERGKQMISFTHEGLPWRGELILSVGVDPASSIANTADDTAIIVAGFCRVWPTVAGEDDATTQSRYPEGVIYPVIAHVEGGRYATHPYQQMRGLAEALIAIDQRYKIDKLKIECNAQQEQIVREIHSTFQRLNMSSKIWKEISAGRKEDRILSIVLPIVQKYDTIICTNTIYIDKIYSQLLMIGIADHDDYADALAIAFKEARIPAIPLKQFGDGELKPSYQKAETFGELDDWLFL
jgi:phage terminase large subunit-like protein